MEKQTKVLFYVYVFVAIVEMVAEYLNHSALRFVSKPLLMIVLAAYYYFSIPKPLVTQTKLMMYALLFAWLGDVSLMFTFYTPHAFLAGLAAFLIGHILYILHFNKIVVHNASSRGFIFENKFVLLIFIAYAVFLLRYIYSGLGDMMIPVFVYCAVILVMCITALNRFGRTVLVSALMVSAGAFMFMFSDSIIALNKFSPLFESNKILASLLIMCLYISGQYFIVEGSIQHEIQSR